MEGGDVDAVSADVDVAFVSRVLKFTNESRLSHSLKMCYSW